MNPKMLKLMRAKKKRPVDPNAPPRPNLMSHDKVIRDQKATIGHMEERINILELRLAETESKLRYQTQYLSHLHNNLNRITKK
jgi:TolA-binding protein